MRSNQSCNSDYNNNRTTELTNYSINNIFSEFHETFFNLVNSYTPWKIASEKSRRKPWIRRLILRLSKRKDNLHFKAKNECNDVLYNDYKRLRNGIQNAKNKSKVKWEVINGSLYQN